MTSSVARESHLFSRVFSSPVAISSPFHLSDNWSGGGGKTLLISAKKPPYLASDALEEGQEGAQVSGAECRVHDLPMALVVFT